MRAKARSRALLGVALGLLAASATAADAPPSPTAAYMAFVAAAQKATTLEELLPFLSAEYRANLGAQPKEKRPIWLQRLKDAVAKTNIKISKEDTNGNKCTLLGTANDKDGTPLKGKVFMVNENGGWKLDAQVWST